MSERSPDGFATCHRCGTDLADSASFCPACGATQRVSPTAGRSGRLPLWMPVAIIVGGVAAIGAGVLMAVILGGRPDTVAADGLARLRPPRAARSSATWQPR